MKSQQPRLIKKKKTHSKLINTFYNMGATRKQDQSSYLSWKLKPGIRKGHFYLFYYSTVYWTFSSSWLINQG